MEGGPLIERRHQDPRQPRQEYDRRDRRRSVHSPRATRSPLRRFLIAYYVARIEAQTGTDFLPPCQVPSHYQGVASWTQQFIGLDGVCRNAQHTSLATLRAVFPFSNVFFSYWQLDLIGEVSYYRCDNGTLSLGPFAEHYLDILRVPPGSYGIPQTDAA